MSSDADSSRAPPEGLSSATAHQALQAHGANELPQGRQVGAWQLLLQVLREPMLLLLLACGAVYLMIGARHEALMLLFFVVVVIALSYVQQRRSSRSLAALRELSSPRAQVLRDGRWQALPSRELVPGDLVQIAEGGRVPADLQLLGTASVSLDESMLTGESVAVHKSAPAQVFSGTLVTAGLCQARVMATGPNSALGRIGASLQALPDAPTPIERETARVVRRVASIGLALAALLTLTHGLANGDWLHGLLAGLTLAMAILPEELPVVLTLFFSLGAWRLARERVLVRQLPAVEMLGAASVLCVDKTGTLTVNQMQLQRLWSEQAAYRRDQATALPDSLHELLEYAVLASHRQAFDPMEQALRGAAQDWLAGTEHLHADWQLVEDYPLSPALLAMSRVWRSPDQRSLLIAAKGAPEAIFDLCHLDATRIETLNQQVSLLAADGLRVLGVARAQFAAADEALPPIQHDFDFEFLGLVALADPVRADVPEAIAACRAAGLRVMMITGDHPATALAIARQIGLASEPGALISGSELALLDDAALRARLPGLSICCRVQPEQKLRIVQALRASGEVVAMTGDGVNDAPALKAADIGVAMGSRGSEVAREAADLVLLGDDFGSLLTALRYGRRIQLNLRKAIVFVLAVHVPIVGLSLLPVLLGWPMLLMPVHILFLQLIIDPACSAIFEREPLEPAAMRAGPRKLDAKLFDAALLRRGLLQGGGLLLLLLAGYALTRHWSGSDAVARSFCFALLVLSVIGLLMANRLWQPGGFWRGLASNAALRWMALGTLLMLAAALGLPGLRQLFAFAALPTQAWPALAAGAALAAAGFALSKRVGSR
ncbi:cation-translocating P-type ATPase [Paucibacter sp. APW11]|uniref:Cation-translocating P-type ATPase n=1 Tax=Roseateles aquae TaxID=3077235 RepID=A0ABU3PDR6_9BURK|nr:cation-translocating P-type ATPase [Paucibacter sp. APW11]MDT9000722.1 cation-translocating P-type ATPase [Paucibacter sp. APW11]